MSYAIRKAELYASWMPRSPRWYVAAIMAGYEATAVEHLSRQGFTPYVPMLTERARNERGKLIEVTRPRFRGYGFVRFDLDDNTWHAINGTRGVRHLLPQHRTQPLALPAGFVERLMAMPERIEDVLAEFATNDLVRVVSGACMGQSATVTGQDEAGADVDVVFPNGYRARLPADEIELLDEG